MGALVSLGSINADFVVRATQRPSGPGTVPGRDFLRTSGGKAANVAVLAARLGMDTFLLACVGDDDLARQALAGPEAAGVDLSGVRRRTGPTGYSGVVVPPDGAKTIVLALNANGAWAEEAGAVGHDVGSAPDGTVVVADLEVPTAVVCSALRAARRRGFPTIVDPAPTDRMDDELVALADHLTPDHEEATQITGIDATSVEGAGKAAAELRDRGATIVHVKLSDGGCVTATPDGMLLVSAPDDVAVVDATGAGDAFAGGLACGLLEGRTLEEAACLAVAASTCAVTGYGSQEAYPSPAELRSMRARVRSQPLA